MSIYVGKTPIYSTRDKILYIESSRSNLVNLDTVNKDPKIKTGDFILGQNTSGITKNFVIEQDNINIISISQSNIYINTPSLFDKNAVIDGNLNVTGDITSLGSLTTNSNLTIGDTLNASIINTSNLSIFNNQLGKIFTAGSNTETGENHEMMYIDTNGGNMYIGGSIGIGTEPNINYSISSSSNIFIGNTLYSSNTLTTIVKHNENSITGIYLTEDGNLILNAEDSVVLNGFSLGNTITIANVNVTGSVTTQKLYTKMSEIINSTDNTNPLNIQKSLESGLYLANPEIGNPISILSGDISNTDGTQDKYTSNIFQLSATGHLTLGGVYPPTSGNKEYLIRGNIDESRISHFDGFLHFTNSNINKQSLTVTKDSRVGIGNQNPTGIFEIKNNFNEDEDTFTPATSMIYLDNSTGLSLPLIESVEYLDDIQSNLIITSNMNYNVYNSNYNIITSNYDIVTCNLISTDLLYDFNTDIYDLIITDTYNITSNLLIGSSNEVEDIIVKNTLFELTSNGTIYFNNDLIDMYRYNIEASNVLSYNLTANNIKSLSSNNIFNFNNSSLSNIGEIYTSNLYFSGEEVFVHNLDVYGDIIAQNVSSSILSTSEEYGFNEIRLTGDKILTTASNVAINVPISHRENQEYINDTLFISPTINLLQDVKALHIKGNHQSMANRVYNSNNSIYVENETVPAKITQEYIVNENTFYIGVKNNSYTSNEDASMFIASSNNEVSYDTINQNNSNIAITIYKNNDIKIGNKTFINKEGYLTLGETEQITSNVLYVKGTAQILTSDETNSFSVKENGIGIGINEPNATVHVNHKQSYDAQYSDMVLIHDHVGDIENHIDDTHFVINRDGNVGIGVSQPSAKLQIADNFLPLTTNSNNLGSEELKWKGIYTNGLEMSDIKLIRNEVIGGLEIQEPNKLQSVSYQYYNTSNNSYYNDYSRTNTMINETSIITKQKNAMFVNKGNIHYNSTAERVINNVKHINLQNINNKWSNIIWCPELSLFIAVSSEYENYTKEPLYNMTANTTVTAVGNYIASASTEFSSSSLAYLAFDSVITNNGWISFSRYNSSTGEYTGSDNLGGYSGEWIKLQLPYSVPLSIFKYKSRHSGYLNRAPKEGVILGSNNNTNWSLLYSFSDKIFSSVDEFIELNINNGTEYLYYAMVISKNNGDAYTAIGEIELITSFNNVMTSADGISWTIRSTQTPLKLSSISWSPELELLAAVSLTDDKYFTKEPILYLTNYSTSTSLGTYIISASSEYSTSYRAYEAFNGNKYSSTDCWVTANRYLSSGDYNGANSLGGYSGEWIKIQLPYSKPLIILRLLGRYGYSGIQSPKTGVIIASNDDSNWDLIYTFTNVTLTSDTDFNNWYINSTTEYSYYAIVVNKTNSTTTHSSIGEIELITSISNIVTSPDGINWTTRNTDRDFMFNSVTWSSELSLFVAVSSSGEGNRVITSSDGITWTTRSTPVDNNWNNILWCPELQLFVAVAISNNTITEPYYYLTNNTTVSNIGTYIASASSEYNNSNTAYRAFNGLTDRWLSTLKYSSGNYTGSNSLGGYAGEWIKLQLPYRVILRKFRVLAYELNRSPNEGVILGSNNGIDWNLLYTYKNQIFSNTSIYKEWDINSKIEYSYYALVVNKVNGESYVTIRQIELVVSTSSSNKDTIISRNGLYLQIASGYHSNNVNYFDTATITSTQYITSINYDLAYIGINVSYLITGNFIPDITGLWSFTLEHDDGAYLWIGNLAVSAYTSSNAFISNTGTTTVSGSIYLIKGHIYPIRLLYGQGPGGARLILTVTNPNNVSTTDYTNYINFSPTNNNIMTSANGINWTTRLVGNYNNLLDIDWSPELKLLVASGIGENGIITSKYGIDWTVRNTENSSWISICWCPELKIFAAVSSSDTGNQLITSYDGILWTTRNTHYILNNWSSIVWSSEFYRFVAVSYASTHQILVSGDPNPKPVNSFGLDLQTGAGGLNVMAPVVNQELAWTTRTSAADNQWRDIVWAPELGLFVAVARSGTGDRVMTSPDGINWTTRTSAADNDWHGITWAPELGLFVAVSISGTGNRIMTSPDGINWTTRSTPADNNWRDVVWAPELGLFVAVADSSTPATIEPAFDMTANTTVTAVGTYIASASTETGGDHLAYRAFNGSPTLGLPWASDNVYSSGNYIGSNSLGGYSGEWLKIQLPYSIPLNQIKLYARDTLYLDQSPKDGYILASNDNTNWTLLYTFNGLTYSTGGDYNTLNINSTTSYSYYAVVVTKTLGNIYAAIGELELLPYFDNVMTSPDGINWTTRTTPVDNIWFNITWAPELGLFVAVAWSGSGNRVMTSPDGINWTTRSTNNNAWISIVWAPELGLFVAVAYSGSGDRVMTSPDGINWTTRSSAADNQWMKVRWVPELGLLIAVGRTGTNNRIMTSPDGINWTTRYSPTDDNHWWGIAWAPELGILVSTSETGTGDRVMTAEGTKIKKSILSIKNNKSQINGPLGIGTEPLINSGVTVIQPISQNDIRFTGASGNTLLHSPGIEISTDTHKWGIFTNYSPDTNLIFASSAINDNYVGVAGYIDNTNTDNALNFTGQHRCYVENKSYTELQNMKGLIVSANKNEYRSMSGGLVSGNKAITIDESLPVVSLTSKAKDITVFGIISDVEDPRNRTDNYGNFVTPYDKETGDTRVYINSVGEGGIWVIDKNGNLESGDFIISSSITGYGIKQEDDILYSYTVAKITMNCDFNPLLQPVRRIKKDANGNNILNEYGNIVWENTEDLESEYNIRYLNIDGIEITEEDYLEKQNNNEEVYKAAFVGCTYHCG